MTKIYLIPSFLSENAVDSIPPAVMTAVRDCRVLFVENERTTRRFLKAMDKSIVIEDFEWHTIHDAEESVKTDFNSAIKAGKNIGIISEAGCPGIADPGQLLIAMAQQQGGCKIIPVTGPNSIILALMASGLNGQHFEFCGYLPVDAQQRIKQIIELEASSKKNQSTKIFIETPYRNVPMFEALINNLSSETRLCVAIDLTGRNESTETKTVREWKNTKKPELHKTPAIFLFQA